jgi:hypothetical protein
MCKKKKNILIKVDTIDYVTHIQLNEESIKLLPNYYKQIGGFRYPYGGYGGHESNFVKLSYFICFVIVLMCNFFVGTKVHKNFGQLCEE